MIACLRFHSTTIGRVVIYMNYLKYTVYYSMYIYSTPILGSIQEIHPVKAFRGWLFIRLNSPFNQIKNNKIQCHCWRQF